MTITTTESKHFTTHNIENLKDMFEQEKDYKKHMNNLWRTRRGLAKIMEERPDLEHIIKPQFDTLNELCPALCSEHPSIYPYPIYHDIDINGEPYPY